MESEMIGLVFMIGLVIRSAGLTLAAICCVVFLAAVCCAVFLAVATLPGASARRMRRAERGRLWPRWMMPIQLRLVRGTPDPRPDVVLTRHERHAWTALRLVLVNGTGLERAAAMEWAAEQAMREAAE